MGRVNMYSYVAASNPYFAKSLAHKYGYEFDKDQRLDTVLQQLVSYEGEPALSEILDNHPDKDVIVEYHLRKLEAANKKDSDKKSVSEVPSYMNFTGQLASAQQVAENRRLTSETSIMVLAGAVLIAFAIITKR